MVITCGTVPSSRMALPDLASPECLALFLDFDGTLVELVERPDQVHLRPSTCRALSELSRLLGGALAIVTGREIASIDQFIGPLRLPVAGIHGLTRRDARGHVHMPPPNEAFLASANAALGVLAAREQGLLVEQKSRSVALHYRARPELEAHCLAAMEEIASEFTGIVVKRGKMVVEAISDGADKGSAVVDFMAEQPFRGRRPVFAGDDVTDEDAFAAVNALGGISIKVGAGSTQAQYRAEGTEAFLAWLEESAVRLARGEKERERT